jgi:hypothetical protein
MLNKIMRLLFKPSGINIGIKIFNSSEKESLIANDLQEIDVLRPSSIRLSRHSIEQIADPFIVAVDNSVFCFYEVKQSNLPGYIQVYNLNKSGKSRIESCSLGETGHISFPFIFVHQQTPYMIPETGSMREIAIYEPLKFPNNWQKKQIIMRGNYVDSHIFQEENYYYLFTTEKIKNDAGKYDYRLMLFNSDSFFGKYHQHPCSPISTDRRYARSGGAILNSGGKKYRVAQDCSNSYGRELHFFEIEDLSPHTYRVSLQIEHWFKHTFNYSLGGHHVSRCYLNNKLFVAVDFNYRDSYLQRFVKLFFKRKS